MFTSTLYLNHITRAGAYHVHVNDSCTILFVAKVRNRPFWANTYGNSCAEVSNREFTCATKGEVHRINEGYKGTCNRCCTRASICLNYIAVDRNRTFTKCFKVYNSAQSTTDKALNFYSAARLFTLCSFTAYASLRRTWQQGVFSGYPTLARTFEPAWHRILHSGCTDNLSLAALNEYRTFCILCKIPCYFNRSQLTCCSIIAAHRNLTILNLNIRTPLTQRGVIFSYYITI